MSWSHKIKENKIDKKNKNNRIISSYFSNILNYFIILLFNFHNF